MEVNLGRVTTRSNFQSLTIAMTTRDTQHTSCKFRSKFSPTAEILSRPLNPHSHPPKHHEGQLPPHKAMEAPLKRHTARTIPPSHRTTTKIFSEWQRAGAESNDTTSNPSTVAEDKCPGSLCRTQLEARCIPPNEQCELMNDHPRVN